MKLFKYLSIATLLCAGVSASAQSSVSGKVTNEAGQPLVGVSVAVPGTTMSVVTDNTGSYTIQLPADASALNFGFVGFQGAKETVNGRTIVDVVLKEAAGAYTDVVVGHTYCKDFTLADNVASVSVISKNDIEKRTARNIANTLFGQGLGLTTLQGRGHYADYNPTFFVRGLKTLEKDDQHFNQPLVLVDGIERNIDDITPYEVESVTILKDASAVAIYGYKGVNGVINITTKRGEYEQTNVDVSYSHSFDRQFRRPEFVQAADYARAVNEAKLNDGSDVYYTPEAIKAYEDGSDPDYFPNVDWQKEALRDWGSTSNYNITFHGGGQKLRYYTMLNLNANRGFNKVGEENNDYKTQDMFSRGSVRTNLDIDLTPTTLVQLNVLGALSETRRTGTNFAWKSNNTTYDITDVWEALYQVPANAFPVELTKNGKKYWGGVTDGSALNGTYNPVALSQDAGYVKNHKRTIYVDLNIKQDLSLFLEGLGASFRLAYDNWAYYVENYTRKYDYASYLTKGGQSVTFDANGTRTSNLTPTVSADGDGNSLATSLSTDSNITSYSRDVSIYGNIFYDKKLSDTQSLYAQLRYDFEKRDSRGVNLTYYFQNFAGYAHYNVANKYIADLTLVASEYNMMAPGNKWAFSPTLALGWVASKEDFLSGSDVIDYLKIRASFGRINSNRIPEDGYWVQTYGGGPTAFMFDSALTEFDGTSMPARMASSDDNHCEKADKLNIGIDAKLGGLDVVVDLFRENRHDIWVDATNKYSEMLGFTAPYETGGQVISKGIEAGLNYTKNLGDITFNVGGKFTFNKNEIKEQYEEIKAFKNLESTGHSVRQFFGYKSVGMFKDEADIASSKPQTLTTVRPGDIKYQDVNNDGVINENDKTAIGYNAYCPEIYYSFNLGAEYKNFGFDIMFQGAAHYSVYLNTESVYLPLVGNKNISKEYFDNRWTAENPNAKYPRLSMEKNLNNNVENTTFVQDRNFLKLRNVEVYYNLPQSLLANQKVVKGAKVFVRGIDLACFDKLKVVDPEAVGTGYPLTQSIVGGLTVQF